MGGSVESDAALVARLQGGDEAAFAALVDRYHAGLLRLARAYVPNAAVAEEAVQDTWLGVVRGIERFEGRSSFKTWLYRILLNRARTAGVRERRTEPQPAVDPARFDAGGAWSSPPVPWTDEVEERLVAAAAAGRIREALDELPPGPRQVVLLRDVDGLSRDEVCEVLNISDGNQRVLLHRGRSKIRALLEAELAGDPGGAS